LEWLTNPFYNSVGQNTTSVAVEAIDTNGNIDNVYNGFVGIKSTNKTSTVNLPGFNIGSGNTYAPGGYMMLKIRLTASNGSIVRVGNLTLNYLSKY